MKQRGLLPDESGDNERGVARRAFPFGGLKPTGGIIGAAIEDLGWVARRAFPFGGLKLFCDHDNKPLKLVPVARRAFPFNSPFGFAVLSRSGTP